MQLGSTDIHRRYRLRHRRRHPRTTKLGTLRSNPPSWTAGQHVTVSLKFRDPTPALSIADASANENAGHLLFDVTLSRASRNTVKVDFETISGGTATEGLDYHARRTYTHVILPGDRTAQMGFALIEDTINDDGETVKVKTQQRARGRCLRRQNTGPPDHDPRGNGNDHRADDHHDQRVESEHSDPRRNRGRRRRVSRIQSQALAEVHRLRVLRLRDHLGRQRHGRNWTTSKSRKPRTGCRSENG